MSQALRKLTANASKCNCTILFLNQLRHKVGVVYGNPEVTSGGQALKFYASVRLEVRRKQTVEDAAGVGIGIKVKAKVSRTASCCLVNCRITCMFSYMDTDKGYCMGSCMVCHVVSCMTGCKSPVVRSFGALITQSVARPETAPTVVICDHICDT